MVAYRSQADYAIPFAHSVLMYGKDTQVIMIDSASPDPYPESDKWEVVRVDYPPGELYNYSRCLNIAARHMDGEWLMFCNDDLLCTGPFTAEIRRLDKKCLYGAETGVKKRTTYGTTINYAAGWCLVMHRSLYGRVGPFDEAFGASTLEDVDYSWRADKLGYKIKRAYIPFIHLESMRRVGVEGWHSRGMDTRKYFIKKVKRGK